ncbi:hypothetical protein B0H11DRAFT_2035300, partial [Mycena galericulata]
MSLSSYIKRQSRVTRMRKSSVSTAPLTSIQEEPVITLDDTTEHTKITPKSNSVKAKRRQGVSDLRIPRASALFTAVQGDADWRLTLDAHETLDFPKPPSAHLEGESSGSECSSSSSSGSESPTSPTSSESDSGASSGGLPTTPTPSPTTESYDARTATEAQCIIRCKSIKPLRVAKRAVSPVPPVPSSSSAAGPSSVVDVEELAEMDPAAWEDDEDFYASHAAGFITLTAPLPPSFPASTPAPISVRAANRESAIIPSAAPTPAPTHLRPSAQLDPTYVPSRGSVRLSRAISIPSRAPPPPPIVTSLHGRSASAASIATLRLEVPNYSRPISVRVPPSRPPPRTPVPCDATWSGDFDGFAADYAAYAPLLSPSPVPSQFSSPSSTTSTGSSASSLAALLSPPAQSPAHRFPAEAQGVPADVDEGDWEECDVAYDYEDVPLSPLVACAPSPSSDDSPVDTLPVQEEHEEVEEKWTFPPSPLPAPGPYTGWHPRPRASQLRAALAASPLLPVAVPTPSTPCTPAACPPKTPGPEYQPQTPALRSRWSSSTLSSIHSAHARSPASPKTFSFARRYFPRASASPSSSSASQKSPSHKAKPRAMGATTPSVVKRAAKGKGKRGKPLTVADVLIVGRPPAPASVLACASPDVFASSSSFSSAFSPGPTPATPFSAVPLTPAATSAASAQPFLLSPCSPAPATPATPYSASAQYAAYPPSPSPALYTAYATQRSPRRRASTASNASKWSYSSSAESASDGCGGSECSSGSSGSGLRRKPIPVEMFL